MGHRIITSFLLLTTLLLFSCKGDKVKDTEKDTILDIAMMKVPVGLHPFVIGGAVERTIFHNIFVPMADYDPVTYELSPILIKEIPEGQPINEGPFAGGTAYEIELREDAKWDDGSPITAEDVLFTIKAIKHPGTNAAKYRSYMSHVSDIQLDPNNPRKFTYIFKDYYILAKELAVTIEIYPKYHYDPDGLIDDVTIAQLDAPDAAEMMKKNDGWTRFADDFNSVKYTRNEPVGAGPYRLKEWITDQRIVLEKKPNYWAKDSEVPALQAHPQEIHFYLIADETSVMTQVKEGNIDLVANVTAESFFDLKNNEIYGDQFEYFTPELMRLYYIDVNNTKPQLADPDVRRALAKLVDVPQLVEILEGGLGDPTVGIFNKKKGYYNDDLKIINLDIEGAQDILQEEGWSDTNADGSVDKLINGQSVEMLLTIHITGSELSKNIALLLQENAKKVGIKIEIITKPWSATLSEDIKSKSYDLVTRVLSQDLALDDPYLKWHSDNDDPSKDNDTGYRSEKADEIIEKIRSTRDDDERIQLYKDLQAVMYADQPVIFLYNPQEKIILSKRWKGTSSVKRPGYFAGTFVAQ